jgi:hypothetical protein
MLCTDLSAAVDAAAHREARLNLSFERHRDSAQHSFDMRMDEANEIAAEHVDTVWAQHRELQVRNLVDVWDAYVSLWFCVCAGISYVWC